MRLASVLLLLGTTVFGATPAAAAPSAPSPGPVPSVSAASAASVSPAALARSGDGGGHRGAHGAGADRVEVARAVTGRIRHSHTYGSHSRSSHRMKPWEVVLVLVVFLGFFGYLAHLAVKKVRTRLR
ncbi:hypothetical protein [Streptomyces noursei]|uniref:Secreted protein n=1 Tax=Streptomyces noursei TaxID=1971 RepID=A0A2N8P975_STRNR|nr:hypothetical protein [Streptomyces noursei]PNE37571.1 hypothetical protein AOB60_25120 [Streptomyces noursei]